MALLISGYARLPLYQSGQFARRARRSGARNHAEQRRVHVLILGALMSGEQVRSVAEL
jgi:hypothetical protein